ncbi:MAG: methyltransferase domain-containing protein [Pseudomonadota bacterium]
MDSRVQRRVQRYGWDRAVTAYEHGWRAQLEPAHRKMLDMVQVQPGDRVLDVACGTGLVTFSIAEAVGSQGSVWGTDLSGEMVETARQIAEARDIQNATFERCDAEQPPFAPATFDAAVCGLGLMYVPDPKAALSAMRRMVCPGGEVAAAVWGTRDKCGWAEIFPITDARVVTDVCPMFFHLGTGDTLKLTFAMAGLTDIRVARLHTTLRYSCTGDVLEAAFQGGPVALAYSRFSDATKRAVHAEYLDSIAAYGNGDGYSIPGEFVVAAARVPAS